MDFKVAFIAIICILVLVIPFWLIIQAEKAKKKKFIQQLLETGRQHHLNLTEYEVWQGKGLGIDSVRKGMIFLNQQQPQSGPIILDLTQATACKMHTAGGETTGKVELQFLPKQGSTALPTIVFFDMEKDDPTQMGTFQEKAKEWVKRVEVCL
jgi:hypothetical protein